MSWRHRIAPLAGILALTFPIGCDNVVVQPADVEGVRIEPTEVEVVVGGTVQLSARAVDGSDRPVSGVPIQWSTANSGIATVSGTGLVTGQGPGTVQVRASVGEHMASAAVVVLRPAVVVFGQETIALFAQTGAPAQPPVEVAITNGGDVPLTGLAADVDFGEGPTGWLDASLAGGVAPTTLAVAAIPTGLDPGTYEAVVQVTHASAPASPATLPVTLTIGAGAPGAPTNPTATLVSPSVVRVSWTDAGNSDGGFQIERRVGMGSFAALAAVGAGVTSHDDESVEPDRTYGYRIRACSAAGCSAHSVVASVTMPPLAPESLATATVSTSAIQISWSDPSQTATGFEVERRVGDGTFSRIASPGGGATGYTDDGLSPNTSHTYRVRACNDGGCSAFSGEASATTPALTVPPPPTGLSAAATEDETRITVTWTASSANETHFRLERRAPGESQFTLLASPEAGSTSHVDDTADPDGTYVYRVAACAAGGCSPFSGEGAATTYPTGPSGLTATTHSSSRIDLAWADNSATETGFRIERKPAGGTFAQIAVAGVNQTTHSDGNLAPETSYTYRVRACNTGGCSAYTAEATATTGATPAPTAPSNLTSTVVAATRIDLEWADNSADETEFRLHRRVNDGDFTPRVTLPANTTTFTDTQVSADNVYIYRVEACAAEDLCSNYSNETTAVTPPVAPAGLQAEAASVSVIEVSWADNVRTATSFVLQRQPPGGSYTEIATLPAGSTGHIDEGLDAETAYTYRIRACNDSGCSGFTAGQTATTHPPAPTSLQVTAVSATALDLSWTNNSTTAQTIRIERRQGTTGPHSEVATLPASATSYTDDDLAPGTTYQYRLQACNTACSAHVSQTGTTEDAPAAPSALSATATSTSSVTVTWTNNSTTAQEFRLERQVESGSWTQIEELGPGAASFNDDGLSPETSYGYRVRACSGGACSPYSNDDTALTWIPAPSGLSAGAVSSTAIDLIWTDNSTTEAGFEIEMNGALVATTPADQTSYQVPDLEPETGYTFRVRAVSPVNVSEWSDPDTAVTLPLSPPPAP